MPGFDRSPGRDERETGESVQDETRYYHLTRFFEKLKTGSDLTGCLWLYLALSGKLDSCTYLHDRIPTLYCFSNCYCTKTEKTKGLFHGTAGKTDNFFPKKCLGRRIRRVTVERDESPPDLDLIVF